MDRNKWSDAVKKCREEYVSGMILMQANKDRFAQLRCNLANDMTKHVDNYPNTIVDTARMLNGYKSVKTQMRNGGEGNDGRLAFAQGGGTLSDKVTCHHCGKKGHYKSGCPNLRVAEQGVQNVNQGDEAAAGTPQPKCRTYASTKRKLVSGWLRSKECGASSIKTMCTLTHAPPTQARPIRSCSPTSKRRRGD